MPGSALGDRRADHEIGLGRAVAVEQGNAGALRELGMEVAGHAGRQRNARAVLALRRLGLARQQDRHHRAKKIGHRRAPRRERGEEGRRREAALEDRGRAGDQCLKEGVERIGVEQRQGRAEDVLGADAQQMGRVHSPPEELGVRAAYALRGAGGARGVEDGQRIARPRRRCGDRLAQRRQGLRENGRAHVRVESVDDPNRLERQSIEVDMLERAQQSRFDHEEPCTGILQDVAELRAARGGVDRHQNGAEPGRAEEDLDELRPVLADQRHAIALAKAGRVQPAGRARGKLGRFGEAPAPLARLDQRLGAVFCGPGLQHGRQAALAGGEEAAGIERFAHRHCSVHRSALHMQVKIAMEQRQVLQQLRLRLGR